MSRSEVMDTHFKKHAVATCDKCHQQWTLDVCEKKGWLLGDDRDLCERCRPRRKEPKR